MRSFGAHENGRVRRVASLALAFASSSLFACVSGDATRTSPCTAPIAGVCTVGAQKPVETPRAVGGGPVEPAPPVAFQGGADAGVAMPQFEYGADGSVRVK